MFPASIFIGWVPSCSHFSVLSGRASSIATILLGSIYYTWVKHVESQQAPKDASKYERVALEDVEAGKGSSKPE